MEQDKAELSKDSEPKVKTYDVTVPEKDPEVELLQQELAQLRESVSKQEDVAKTYLEQIRRLQADFENWRKRVEQEKITLVENASSVLAQKLLPVLDSFERALQGPVKSKGDSSFREGMNLIYRQFVDLLKEEGLTPIESVGTLFDPKLHEAVEYEEKESGDDHTVLEEARKGYLFKGRVLRPALVKVLKLKDSGKGTGSTELN